jgi:hypothetical protein
LDFLAAAAERKVRSLGTGVTREHPGVVTLTEEEDAKVIHPEFYPETEAPEEAAPAAEIKEIVALDKLVKRMKLTKAKKDALLHHYQGDLEAATTFLNNVLKATRKLKPSQKQVTEWLEQGITNPDWLMKELSEQIKKLKPEPEKKNPPPGPAAPDEPPPSDDGDEPPPKKQSGWDF